MELEKADQSADHATPAAAETETHPISTSQRLKRTLQEYEQSILQQQAAAEQELLDEAAAAAVQTSKQVKLTTSKILGVANPRKPRVGPQFQVEVPEWHGPKQQ